MNAGNRVTNGRSVGGSVDITPPAISINGNDWWEDDVMCNIPINGVHQQRSWSVRNSVGESFGPGTDSNLCNARSRLDYFLMMMPQSALVDIVRYTNQQLHEAGKTGTTTGEMLKFFGVLILATKFEFTDRRSLWKTTAPSKYIPAPNFGRTGMSKNRFDDIFASFRTGHQPNAKPDTMSSEEYRWLLVDNFVKHVNEHRINCFTPSDLICVDESISRWYGQGGGWINHGLPVYVALDRKPDNGCEIQNACCGRSGVMIQLKLVKSQQEEEGAYLQEDDDGLLHGTKVLLSLVKPWAGSWRLICADSYFASVPAAKTLIKYGLYFIGVIKSATRGFPIYWLSQEVQFFGEHIRGQRKGLFQRGENPGVDDLLAFVWVDRERRYFIASKGCLAEGVPYDRWRWRQVDNITPDALPERVQLTVPQPLACEYYYSASGQIDRHNRHRSDTLCLEHKFRTHSWDVRVNMTILAIIIVDTWLVWDGCHKDSQYRETQKEFYTLLAEELIDNSYDIRSMRIRTRGDMYQSPVRPGISVRTGTPTSGVGPHLTPTKKKRMENGVTTNKVKQGRCKICFKKSKYNCSVCRDSEDSREVYICHSETGRDCFSAHLEKDHNEC
jgi:hypothetical protein